LFGLLCAWREVQILRQHTFWHAQWDQQPKIKMPDISDILDVAIEDLSPEQLQQLKDTTDQFQQKCLMSFKKNRSGVPYLKNEMPRVLLSGETDATTLQEKEECLQAFRDTAEDVMGKHHRAFLGVFKQMMVGVFGLGIEQVFNRAPPQGYNMEIGESSSQPPLRSQPVQPPPQSVGSQPSSLLHKTPEVKQFNLLCGPQEGIQSSRLHKAVQVNRFNNRTHISLRMGSWRLARLGFHILPPTKLPQLATDYKKTCTVEATMK
jgi:hypothetical protein